MDSVVKVDSELLKKIQVLVKKNKFQYSSNKQVVNLAILEFLNLRKAQQDNFSDELKNPIRKEGFLNTHSVTKKKEVNQS